MNDEEDYECVKGVLSMTTSNRLQNLLPLLKWDESHRSGIEIIDTDNLLSHVRLQLDIGVSTVTMSIHVCTMYPSQYPTILKA